MSKVIPILSGLFAFGAHAAWNVFFSGTQESGWGRVAPSLSESVRAFSSSGAPWLGASYALSAAFMAYALLTFREDRRRAAAGAVGGLAAMGALYAVGCFAIGCCGSPMLPVYLCLLGGKYARLSGPLMFGLTFLSVGIGFLILGRKARCVCEGRCAEEAGGQG